MTLPLLPIQSISRLQFISRCGNAVSSLNIFFIRLDFYSFIRLTNIFHHLCALGLENATDEALAVTESTLHTGSFVILFNICKQLYNPF